MIIPRSRLRRVALLLPVLGLVLGGCGSDSQGIRGPAAVKLPVSGKVLLVAGPFHQSGMGEVMQGKPEFVSGGCLGFASNDQVYVAVWPNGTKISSGDDDTLIVNGHALTPDSVFSMKASLVHEPFPEQFPEIPLPCRAGGLQAVAWVHQVMRVEE